MFKLPSICFGDHSEGYHLVTAGLHGNEAFAVEVARSYAAFLEENKIDLPIKIIPVCNPYGYRNSYRCNTNDVDLNRNFNFNVDPALVRRFRPQEYPGRRPFSEKETKALVNECKNALSLVDLHGFGNMAVMPSINTSQAEAWLRQAGLNHVPRFNVNSFYPCRQVEGTMVDYYSTQNVPSVVLELGSSNCPSQNKPNLEVYINWIHSLILSRNKVC